MSESLSTYNQHGGSEDGSIGLDFDSFGAQIVDNTSSGLHGKIISKVVVQITDFSGSSSGNIQAFIIKGSDGSTQASSDTVSASSLNNAPSFSSKTFTFSGNAYPMNGSTLDYIQFRFNYGGSGSSMCAVKVTSNGQETNTHAAVHSGSWNMLSNTYDICMDVYVTTAPPPATNMQVGIAWRTSGGPTNANQYHALWSTPTTLVQNSSNDLSIQVYVTLTGTPNHLYHPLYITGGNDYAAIQISGPSAGLVGQRITKCTFRLSKVGTPTGTLYCKIRKGGGGADIVFGSGGTPGAGLDVSTLSLTSNPSAEYVFQNLDNGQTTGYPLAVGDRIILELAAGGSSTSSNYVQVARTHTISTMPDVQMQLSADGSTWTTPSSGNDDVIGVVATGGHTTPIIFPYHTLGYQNDRISQKVTSSVVSAGNIYNQKITQVEVWLKRVGSPTGTINAVIRNSTGTSISTLNQINAIDVDNADFTQYSFTNLNQNHPMGLNERISIEYSGGNVNDHILVNTNLTDSYPYGVLEKYSAGTFIEQAGHDIAGSMSSGGGSTDPLARPRVGERVGTTNSLIKLKTISRIKVRMKRTGTPPGSVFFRIRSATDPAIKAELGSKLASEIDPNVFTEYTITSSPISLHGLQVDDIVSVEYNDGDQVNFVEVMHTKTSDGFDGPTNTYMVKYDDINWVSNNAVDLVGQFWEGGETFTPSQEDVILPPAVYTKDLTILAGSTPWTYIDHTLSTFTHAPSQLNVNAVMPDFRFYRKVLTTTELLNIFANRSDRGAITFGQVTKIGFFSTTET